MRLNHVDRAKLVNPGIPPKEFFLIALVVFMITGVVIFLVGWLRHSALSVSKYDRNPIDDEMIKEVYK